MTCSPEGKKVLKNRVFKQALYPILADLGYLSEMLNKYKFLVYFLLYPFYLIEINQYRAFPRSVHLRVRQW